ncbi:LSU ribosomal protein L9p [hydrothermal vent metagenome]|uniref:LSU ribosomal protein L9p n=1 Tax=hydrothermal vent metagenome TaxID=652676 RepID=A0A3B1C8U4_9ZZZZ
MKVVLNDYVEHLGDQGDKVEVARGYARNYLIPKKLAFEATPENLRTYENNLNQRARKITKIINEAESLKAKLDSEEAFLYTRKSSEGGKIFGSVTSADIEGSLNERGYSIEKKRIVLTLPIKSLGVCEITIKLHKNVTATIKAEVRPEEPEEPEEGEENVAEPEETDAEGIKEQEAGPVETAEEEAEEES